MNRRRIFAILILVASIPLLWFGINYFEFGGIDDARESIAIASSAVIGLFGVMSGLVMLFTKRLGMWDARKVDPSVNPLPRFLRKETKAMKKPITTKEEVVHTLPTKKEREYIEPDVEEFMTPATFKEQFIDTVGSSIQLMKREKELIKRSTELETLLAEAVSELTSTRDQIKSKGWIDKGGKWEVD